eukprot:240351-Pleurochrysis_carterae.AAC.1
MPDMTCMNINVTPPFEIMVNTNWTINNTGATACFPLQVLIASRLTKLRMNNDYVHAPLPSAELLSVLLLL